MKKLRKVLKNTIYIHVLAFLGLFSLWGYIETQNEYILMGLYLSVVGAICGSFIKVVDLIKNSNREDR